MTCQLCSGTGWQVTDAGAKRCQCFVEKQAQPQGHPISPAALTGALKALQAMSFFPTEPAAQMLIGDELLRMCPSLEALQHTVALAVRSFRTWDKCGLAGLRQAMCHAYRPADGIEAGPTEMYPEGLPSETKRDPLALPAGEKRRIAGPATQDARMDRQIRMLAQAKSLDRVRPKPEQEPMSEARRAQLQREIDREVERQREQRANTEKESA